MEDESQSTTIVIPGELMDATGRKKPGPGTYRRDGQIFAKRMGLRSDRADEVSILPLGGVYDPVSGDLVIGVVIEHGPSNWLTDINGPYPAPLSKNCDTILCKILYVDESKKIQVTMNDRNLRKLTGGILLDVEPSRVARIIGKNGSMINLIKRHTDVWLFVGQNGRIWLNGEPEGIKIATDAVRKIEREAHIPGLTDRMKAYLSDRTGRTLSDTDEGTDQEEDIDIQSGEEE